MDTAFKHGVSELQIREALADPFAISEDLEDDAEGNGQDMTIGKTFAEVLLEVGIKYSEDEWVFHANHANARYKAAYDAGKQ